MIFPLNQRLKAAEDSGRGVSITQKECKNFIQLRAENDGLREDKDMSDGCFAMIAEALEKVGCCHGYDMSAVPPMSYDDRIYCSVALREKQIKVLKEALSKTKLLWGKIARQYKSRQHAICNEAATIIDKALARKESDGDNKS